MHNVIYYPFKNSNIRTVKKIHSVEFKGSFVNYQDLLLNRNPEYAFIGRSNVGKSSLINTLLDRKNVARTSNTPGKTQTINLYVIDHLWNIVDLPGYGYARISKLQREKWKKMIDAYLLKRKNLINVFLLIDSRIPPQEQDVTFANWLGENSIPFCFVFTKGDKLKATQESDNIKAFHNVMMESWESLPSSFVSSSISKRGKAEILEFILNTNRRL